MLNKGARSRFGSNSVRLIAGSTQIKARTTHKPGGVLAMITGNTRGRISEMGNDDHGRWSYIKLASPNKPITIITTYQVCEDNPRESGPTTNATQLHAAYSLENRMDPHKLWRHHTNGLIKFVQQCQRDGEGIVLAGDLYETLGDTATVLTWL